jgi:hypothetical protein
MFEHFLRKTFRQKTQTQVFRNFLVLHWLSLVSLDTFRRSNTDETNLQWFLGLGAWVSLGK